MRHQLPVDCLNRTFEYLKYKDIYTCLFVNRFWCMVAVQILWKSIWNYHTLISSLPKESKEILTKNGILVSDSTSKPPLFNYVEFIKSLSIDEIDRKVETLLKGHQKTYLNYNHYNKHIVTREIFKMFMKRIYSLKELEFSHLIRYVPFTTYPGAMDCLKNLSELSCSSNIYSEFFYQLSEICLHIRSLNITFNNVTSNGLTHLISVQRDLRYLMLFDFEDLNGILPLLIDHSANLIELSLYGQRSIPLSFLANFINLRELVLSFDYHRGFENLEGLQTVTFPQLRVLKFSYGGSNHDRLIKFLETNGKNLRELTIGDSDDSLNFNIAQTCPNLISLFTVFKKNELETLKIILKGCQQLESIRVWCGDPYLSENDLLRVIAKYSPKNFHELRMNYSYEKDEYFLISWRNRNREQNKNQRNIGWKCLDENEQLNEWLNYEWWNRNRNGVNEPLSEWSSDDERWNRKSKSTSEWLTGRNENEWLTNRNEDEWLMGRSEDEWSMYRNESEWSMGRNESEWSMDRDENEWSTWLLNRTENDERTYLDEDECLRMNHSFREELESFFISWTNRIPKKSFSLILIGGNGSIKLEVKKESIEVIEKYKKLGVLKNFEIIGFYDFEL